jgi:signal transduction histidine kinase/ligand-binding sensor domain-containing protein
MVIMRILKCYLQFAGLTVLLCLAKGGLLHAQPSFYNFTNYTVASGMPDNYVQGIVEDSRGFMWFGTKEGLSRFDGEAFKNFFASKDSSKTSLKDNAITFLNEFKPGYLSFASSGKLTVMNTLTLQFAYPAALEHKKIYRLAKGESGTLYASTVDTCFILNDTQGIASLLLPPFKERGNIVTVGELNDSLLVLGYIKEYFIYNRKTQNYTEFPIEPSLPYSQRFINFQYWDKLNQRLYFSNFYSGLLCYDTKATLINQWKHGKLPLGLPEPNISFVNAKNEHQLWIGTYEGGLFVLDKQTNLVIQIPKNSNDPAALASNTIVQSYTDREQNTWLATSKGVSKINANATIIKSWNNEFQSKDYPSTLLDIRKGPDGNIYQTLFNVPICYRINPATDSITRLDIKRLPKIWCLNNMGDKLLFGGMGTTVTSFDPRKNTYEQSDFLKKYFPESELIILAFKQKNGDEWYSGNRGGGFVRISATDGAVHTYKKDGPRGKFTISYYANCVEDKSGDLWFAVNKSEKLLHWDHQRDYFQELSFDSLVRQTNPLFTGIMDLAIDGNDNIWVAFEGAGLLSYNIFTRKAKRYLNSDGLPTNYLNTIVFDGKHRLWIGTAKGLSCFLIKENKFLTYTVFDGLPADDFYENSTLFDSSSGKLWIAANNTLLSFYPDSLLQVRNKKIPVYIDEINVNGKAHPTMAFKNESFEPAENYFQFHFVAVDLENGKDMQYAYRMEGADKDWVEVGKVNTASYANLNPGKYSFYVRAKHRGDIEWAVTDRPYTFIIGTPWFSTWWFRLLSIMLISLLVWYIIRSYYKAKLEKEKNILERKQAIEKERTRIATDMHDDFGANLSRIKFISEKIQVVNQPDEGLKADLVKISAFSDEMAEKMNEIVWALNQRYDSLEDLISFSRAYAADYLQDKNIELKFSASISGNKNLHGELRRNVFMVIKETLHNVIKHANAKLVSIDFTVDANLLKVQIEDDGKGIDLENIRPFANGIENMQKRIESVAGQFSVIRNQGTVITIQVPL